MDITKGMTNFLDKLDDLLIEHEVSIVRSSDGFSICLSMKHDDYFEDALFNEEITSSDTFELKNFITKVNIT